MLRFKCVNSLHPPLARYMQQANGYRGAYSPMHLSLMQRAAFSKSASLFRQAERANSKQDNKRGKRARTERLYEIIKEEAERNDPSRFPLPNQRHLSRQQLHGPLPHPNTLELPELTTTQSKKQDLNESKINEPRFGQREKPFEETSIAARQTDNAAMEMVYEPTLADFTSMDDISFDAGDVGVGDLVETQRGSTVRLLIVTSRGNALRHYEGVGFKDEIVTFRTTDIVFHSPNFLRSQEFVELFPNGLTMPNTDTVVDIDAILRDKDTETLKQLVPLIIARFDRAALSRQWTKMLTLQTIYDKYHREEGRDSVTLTEVAQRVFGVATRVTEIERYATHRYLHRNILHFIPEKGLSDSFERVTIMKNQSIGRYKLRPAAELERIERAIRLVRDRAPEFKQFMDHVRSIIAQNVPVEQPSSDVKTVPRPKSLASVTDPNTTVQSDAKAVTAAIIQRSAKVRPFNDTEVTFLELARAYLHANVNGSIGNPFILPLTSILKPLRRYGDLTCGAAMQFLIDLGIWPTWETTNTLEESVPLFGLGISPVHDALAEKVEKLADKLLETPLFDYEQKIEPPSKPIVIEPSGPNDFYEKDIVGHLRHDFGMLPVYTIDDPTAKELDDGISIERKSNNEIWLHVHVADPTAYIPPAHKLAQTAELRGQTVYHPERHYPMLPNRLSIGRFSLGTGKSGEGRNAMSFSMRINPETGEILESFVRPSVIRNVHVLHYDDVDNILDWTNVPGTEGSTIRRRMYRTWEHNDGKLILSEERCNRSTENLPSVYANEGLVQDLRDLQVWARAHMNLRMRQGMMSFAFPKGSISLQPYPLPFTGTELQPLVLVAPHIASMKEPSLKLQLDRAFHSPSRIMVAEMMIMAGRVCADWCRERSLPTLYRSQRAPESMPQALLERVRASVDPRTCLLDFMTFQEARMHMLPALITTTPIEHWTMGIPEGQGYIKCTSPLRRYVDMVVHWQIKAQLLREHDPKSNYKLPFSLKRMEELAPRLMGKERLIQRNQNSAQRAWILEFIRRVERGEGLTIIGQNGEPMEWKSSVLHWPAIVIELSDLGDANVLLTDLGITARIPKRKSSSQLRPGDKVFCRFTSNSRASMTLYAEEADGSLCPTGHDLDELANI